ncbi:MAG: IS4 family transposase [Solimonas sp.]
MMSVSARAELGSAAGLAWISQRVSESEDLSRYRLAREVCERFDWRDATGRLKEMACRKELVRLERSGTLVLPAARPVSWQAREGPAPEAAQFCGELSELGKIELQVVTGGTAGSGQWNGLMRAHHPQGSGPLCGAQLRYLIVSPRQGVLGGLSVSAPAWRLSARDDWLGWSDEKREEHLSGIVCNSRFLIVPAVVVKNLASHVLGLLARRIVADWRGRYGIAPWLMETCVEATRSGTVYRAANWIEVGLTAGRGRQDGDHQRAMPVKRVFLRVLDPPTLKRLCGTPRVVVPGWVHREFAGARLGDRRLERRLLDIATAFAARPTAAVPQACAGAWPAIKAAYRFFDNKSTTMDRLLEPHRGATIDRMRREPVVLVVQDTTSLNYTGHPATQGIGPIGSSADGPKGLLLHNTMAFRPDGLALGLLAVHCWQRTKFGVKKQRRKKAIADKESGKWLKPLATVEQAARHCPNSRLVTVCDREADIYEFFELAHRQGHELLVRATQNRGLHDGGGGRLRAHMESLPQAAEVELAVPRHGTQPARIARIAVRFAELTLAPPRKKKKLPPLTMTVVWSCEIEPPLGVKKPLQWMLLSNRPVQSLDEALERLRWYACRWNIEVFHRTLKSGCQIEERQLGTADRLQACLAIDMVVAWRIQHLTWFGRAVPDMPCTAVFTEDQWKAIIVVKTQKPPPHQPPTLRQMILLVASLGGFIGRKSDGQPGTKSLWLGLQTLDAITIGYRSALAAFPIRPP